VANPLLANVTGFDDRYVPVEPQQPAPSVFAGDPGQSYEQYQPGSQPGASQSTQLGGVTASQTPPPQSLWPDA